MPARRCLVALAAILLTGLPERALPDAPMQGGSRILFGDLYGAGEYREAARGLSMALRAALRRNRALGTLVDAATLEKASEKKRVVHQAVAAEWLQRSGATFAIGGTLEPDGGGVRLMLRVYGGEGQVVFARGYASPGSDLHALAGQALGGLLSDFAGATTPGGGGKRPRKVEVAELPWFGLTELSSLGTAAFAIEAGQSPRAISALEAAARNRPALEAYVRADEDLALRLASDAAAPTWVRVTAKLISGRAGEARDEAIVWQRERPADVLAGTLVARAHLALGKPAEAEHALRALPEVSETLYWRGMALRALKKPKEAQAAFDRVVKLGAEQAPAAMLALAEVEVAQKDPGAGRRLGAAAERLLAAGDVALAQTTALRALKAGVPIADPFARAGAAGAPGSAQPTNLAVTDLRIAELPPKDRALVASSFGVPPDGRLSTQDRALLSRLEQAGVPITSGDKAEFAAFERRPLTEQEQADLLRDEALGGSRNRDGTTGADKATAADRAELDGKLEFTAAQKAKKVTEADRNALSEAIGAPKKPGGAGTGGGPAVKEDTAHDILKDMIVQFSSVPAKKVLQAAMLTADGKSAEARAILLAAGAGGNPRAREALARAYMAGNQAGEAVKLLGHNPGPLMAQALEQAGDPARAAEVYRQTGHGNDPEALRAAAMAAFMGGDANAAKAQIDRVLAANPQDVSALIVSAAVEQRLGNGQAANAAAALAKGLQAPGMAAPMSASVQAVVRQGAASAEAAGGPRKVDQRDLEAIARPSLLAQAMLKLPLVRALAEANGPTSLSIVVREPRFSASSTWLMGLRPKAEELRKQVEGAIKLLVPRADVRPPATELQEAANRASSAAFWAQVKQAHLDLSFELVAWVQEKESGDQLLVELRPIHRLAFIEPPVLATLKDPKLMDRTWIPMILTMGGSLFAGFLLLGLITLVRGRGTIVVMLEYDTKFESGLFSLALSRRKKTIKLKGGDEGAYAEAVRKGGAKTGRRFASMIKQMTVFPKMPTGRWFVYLYGVTVDSEGKPKGNYVIEKECNVLRGVTENVEFDLVGKNAVVMVDVWDQKGPVPKALVIVNDDNGRSLYTGDRGAGVVFSLPLGEHTIKATRDDRAAMTKVKCDRPKPYHVTVRFGVGEE